MANNINVGDEKSVKRGKRAAKEAGRQWLMDLENVMSTESGRRAIFHIINDICHTETSSAQPSGSWTYFAEGERNVGRQLKAGVFEAAFDNYQLMEREHFSAYVENTQNEKKEN